LATGLSSCAVAPPATKFSPSAVFELAPKFPRSSAQNPRLNPSVLGSNCAAPPLRPHFLVWGGGSPASNEIAIEKNVLYFQRTLKALGLGASQPQIYFANGNSGEKTIRFIDPKTEQEHFKAPAIPGLLGQATWSNLQAVLTRTTQQNAKQPIFFYFTGHGNRNPHNVDNNSMILWNEQDVTVQDFASQLDRLPQKTRIVAVMVQCFSGAFANFIYEKGDPQRPVALQTRCGFFATIKQRPSVGCTPLVDEADYEDYSSSFFAGLSGVDRVGRPVASADYDRNGRVSYREAHAFAKVDEQASDLPISTSEAWLRDRFSDAQAEATMKIAIADILQTARPEQSYVVKAIVHQFEFDPSKSFLENLDQLPFIQQVDELPITYLTRLQLELINIAAEKSLRDRADKSAIAVLDRLLQCEAGAWK
jgi:hypothetical protein